MSTALKVNKTNTDMGCTVVLWGCPKIASVIRIGMCEWSYFWSVITIVNRYRARNRYDGMCFFVYESDVGIEYFSRVVALPTAFFKPHISITPMPFRRSYWGIRILISLELWKKLAALFNHIAKILTQFKFCTQSFWLLARDRGSTVHVCSSHVNKHINPWFILSD